MLFVSAISELTSDRSTLLDTCQTIIEEFADTEKIDRDSKARLDEMDIISGLIKELIDENAGTPMNQSKHNERYDGYAERFNKVKDKYDSLQKLKVTRTFQADIIECYIFEINALPDLPIEYSDWLWYAIIDYVTIYNDERLNSPSKTEKRLLKPFEPDKKKTLKAVV